MGGAFQVIPSNAPEEQLPGEEPAEMVRRLSWDKARTVAAGLKAGYVIGADSTVVLEGRSIGKPADEGEARRMLGELRGTRHQVVTGLTVLDAATGRWLTESLTGEVAMRDFTDGEMEASIASGVPMDKAGAYAIQDREFQPARLEAGCYSNVVGLPLCRLAAMLQELGYALPGELPAEMGAECRTDCPLRDGQGGRW